MSLRRLLSLVVLAVGCGVPESGVRPETPEAQGGAGGDTGLRDAAPAVKAMGGSGGIGGGSGGIGGGSGGAGGAAVLDAGAGGAGGAASTDARPTATADASGADATPTTSPIVGVGAVETVATGFVKADTPAWRPAEGVLLFTDLGPPGKHLKLTPPKAVAPFRDGGYRCTTAPDGALVCGGSEGVVRVMGAENQVIADKFPDGTQISLNDVAVSKKGVIFFSNLKAPDPPGKGSLNAIKPGEKTVTVLWDGRMETTLANPNGVAVSPDDRYLYVGISNYDARSWSAVYRFPLKDDGLPDVAVGKTSKWAAVQAPDGIAVDTAGNVYFTAGGVVHVYAPTGKSWGTIKIPSGSGTNIGFGGADLRTLYITTNTTLYAVRVGIAGLP